MKLDGHSSGGWDWMNLLGHRKKEARSNEAPGQVYREGN